MIISLTLQKNLPEQVRLVNKKAHACKQYNSIESYQAAAASPL